MKQNKKRKQTLESARYGLEIIFNLKHATKTTYSFKDISCTSGYVGSKTKRFMEDVFVHFCCIPTVKWRLKRKR